jgi:hypothetical protein
MLSSAATYLGAAGSLQMKSMYSTGTPFVGCYTGTTTGKPT